jgi:hypothetical protein
MHRFRTLASWSAALTIGSMPFMEGCECEDANDSVADDGGVDVSTDDPCAPGATLVATTANLPMAVTLDSTRVYWTTIGLEPDASADACVSTPLGSVESAPRGGGTASTLISNLPQPTSIAHGGGYVAYGASGTCVGTESVGYAKTTGADNNTVAKNLEGIAPPVAVDGTNVYWTSYDKDDAGGITGSLIQSATLSGGPAVTVGTTSGSWVMGLTVHSETLYMTASGSPDPYFAGVSA